MTNNDSTKQDNIDSYSFRLFIKPNVVTSTAATVNKQFVVSSSSRFNTTPRFDITGDGDECDNEYGHGISSMELASVLRVMTGRRNTATNTTTSNQHTLNLPRQLTTAAAATMNMGVGDEYDDEYEHGISSIELASALRLMKGSVKTMTMKKPTTINIPRQLTTTAAVNAHQSSYYPF